MRCGQIRQNHSVLSKPASVLKPDLELNHDLVGGRFRAPFQPGSTARCAIDLHVSISAVPAPNPMTMRLTVPRAPPPSVETMCPRITPSPTCGEDPGPASIAGMPIF